MNEPKNIEQQVAAMPHLPNSFIGTFLDTSINNVLATKKTISSNAMASLDARLESYLK